MPYPPYIDDTYLVALQAWLPLIILLSYLYPAINIVKDVVHEKENKLKVIDKFYFCSCESVLWVGVLFITFFTSSYFFLLYIVLIFILGVHENDGITKLASLVRLVYQGFDVFANYHCPYHYLTLHQMVLILFLIFGI